MTTNMKIYSAFTDEVLNEAELLLKTKNKVLLDKSNNLSWWERNFTNKDVNIANEIRWNWTAFSIFQDKRLKELQRLQIIETDKFLNLTS